MRLLLTTLGRPHGQRTLVNMMEENWDLVTLVVQPHEEDYMRWAWPGLDMLVLPPEINTLGKTRAWLLRNTRKRFGPRICLLDDDLNWYYRPDPSRTNLRYPENPQIIRTMFSDLGDALNDYAHALISAREGNGHIQEEYLTNVRYMRCLAYNTDMIPESVSPRVDGMSDFDVNLQLLRRGLESFIWYKYSQGQPGTATKGGMEDQRDHLTHANEIRKMCELHPRYVKQKMKFNKTGGEFGARLEVIIKWKEAFRHADLASE